MVENLVSYKCFGKAHDKNVFFRQHKSVLFKIKVGGHTIPSFIRQTLKSIYHREGKWRQSEDFGGIYDTGHKMDDKGRSLLNYLDTNYNALCALVNWINKQIIDKKIKNYTQIDFYLSNWVSEIFKLFKIISENKRDIFNSKSIIMGELLDIMRKTSEIGDNAEKITIKKLREKGITDIKQAMFGEKSDWAKGIDIVFSYNGEVKTIQTKSYGDIKEDKNYYIFYQVSNIKYYDPKTIDFFSFYNKHHGFYMFNNHKTIEYLKNNSLKIPKYLKRDFSRY